MKKAWRINIHVMGQTFAKTIAKTIAITVAIAVTMIALGAGTLASAAPGKSSLKKAPDCCQEVMGRNLYFTRPMMKGEDVRRLQQILHSLGHYQGKPNGIFDRKTREAVRKMQKAQGIKMDGVVGPETMNILLGHEEMMDRKEVKRLPPGEVALLVNAETSSMKVQVNGKTVKTFNVCVGKPQTPSPVGKWKIAIKELSHGGVYGVRFMLLNVPWGNYGIHGTNDPWSIGGNFSLGCIRMHNEDVRQLFEWIKVGTPVTIEGWLYSPYYEERPVIKEGMKGSEVWLVQQQLKEKGYLKGEMNGYFGPQTKDALKQFQKDHGFEPDGQVTMNVYGALGL